jgi:hypothetical protein
MEIARDHPPDLANYYESGRHSIAGGPLGDHIAAMRRY